MPQVLLEESEYLEPKRKVDKNLLLSSRYQPFIREITAINLNSIIS